MKQKDVTIGMEARTRISGSLVRVRVLSGPAHASMSRRAATFEVERCDNGRKLRRTAAALRPVIAAMSEDEGDERTPHADEREHTLDGPKK